MKTPHRIKLVKQGASTYNPITDKHEEKAQSSKIVPCLVNFIDQQRAFEAYGSRSDVVMICRFNQEQKPFATLYTRVRSIILSNALTHR